MTVAEMRVKLTERLEYAQGMQTIMIDPMIDQHEQVLRSLIDAVTALEEIEQKQGMTIFNESRQYMDGANDAFREVGRFARETLAAIAERMK